MRWPDSISFTLLTDEGGWSLVKTHGLGVNSFALLRRFPFTTCDGTGWARTAAFGSICFPHSDGAADYALYTVCVSRPNDAKLQAAPSWARQSCDRFLAEECGTDIGAVSVNLQ